jgi:hypothetical protein
MSDELRSTRREIIKKMAFVTPVILTFSAAASFAKAGSSGHEEKAKGKDKDREHKEKWYLRHG